MSVRVDKWLWAVRIYRTRSQATDACNKGRVLVRGETAKPATRVDAGDEVQARRRDRTIIVEVAETIEKRVSAGRAAECLIDRSPPRPERPTSIESPGTLAGVRERGAGRPTKRERRQLEQWQGRRR